MSDRSVPPLPAKKPPVPTSFKLNSLFSGIGSGMPIPPLSFTGGAAAPATSGGVGTQGNIGNVTINKNKGIGLWTYAFIGVGFLAWLKWGKK